MQRYNAKIAEAARKTKDDIKRGKVFKNGPSEIYGRQLLKNLKEYGLPQQTKCLKCSLYMVLAWALSATNSLQNVHAFGSNQLVFGPNPSFSSALTHHLPKVEGKTNRL